MGECRTPPSRSVLRIWPCFAPPDSACSVPKPSLPFAALFVAILPGSLFFLPAVAAADPTPPAAPVAVGAVKCPGVVAKDPAKETSTEATSRASCTDEAKAGIAAGLAALPAPKAGLEVSANVEKAGVKGGEGTAQVALLVKEKSSQKLVAVVHATASVRGGTGKDADLLRVAIRRAAESAVKRSAPVLDKKR